METGYHRVFGRGEAVKHACVAGVPALSMQQWLLGVAFLIYAGLLALVISRHEPWADEAQAWLMARDLRPFDLFVHFLRYEGTPGLWHAVLLGPAKAGLPYFSMSIISGIIATCGVFLLLAYSRIPLLPRLLLPFSFVLLYQYAVVARSYVLLPILLFGIAVMYKDRAKRIYLFTLLLCLLANANLHGMLIALSLAMIYILGLPWEWSSMEPTARRQHLAAIGVFGVVMSLLVLQLAPPADSAFAGGPNPDYIARLVVRSSALVADCITVPGVPWLSVPIVALSLAWFWRHKVLWEYLVPTTALLLLFALRHVAAWHEGVLFLVWLLPVWIGFEHHSAGVNRGGSRLRIVDELFVGVVVLVASIQIVWSVFTIQGDLGGNYSGSREAADYIKAHNLQGRTIYVTGYHSVAILPYFQDNIFANLNGGRKPAYWWWSTKNPLIQDKLWDIGNTPKVVRSIRQEKPDIVILSVTRAHHRMVLPLAGYVVAAECEGSLYWKVMRYESSTFIILRREDVQLPAAGRFACVAILVPMRWR